MTPNKNMLHSHIIEFSECIENLVNQVSQFSLLLKRYSLFKDGTFEKKQIIRLPRVMNKKSKFKLNRLS